jgi:hypothetical protein
VDDLDIRQSDVLMWLPLIRFSRMLGAHAEFLDQMIVDSAQPTMVIAYTPVRLDS